MDDPLGIRCKFPYLHMIIYVFPSEVLLLHTNTCRITGIREEAALTRSWP